MRIRALTACALALGLAAAPGTASARVPGRTPSSRLSSAVAEEANAPEARGGVAGVLLMRGRSTILGVNADVPLPPASLMKIATTTAALLRFGPTHRFATRVTGPRPVSGIASGSITLVGGGDPTLASAAFANKYYHPQPGDPGSTLVFPGGSPTVEELARGVASAGVRRVHGDLVVDDSLFDSVRTAPGWIPAYTAPPEIDVGYISALTVNEGYADIELRRIVASPALEAGRLLKAALGRAGVVVEGAVRAGRAGAGVELARVESPPLSRIVWWTNHWSINGAAEMLLKGLGARFGRAGSTLEGARITREALQAVGVPTTGFQMEDGSGLSVLNRMTPRMMAALIGFALAGATPVAVAMRDSFPIAGRPGTLFKRMRAWPVAGNLRGKTGLIRTVRCMAGWVTGRDGIPIVYVAMFSKVASPIALNGPLDRMGLTLTTFPLWPFSGP